MIFVLVSIAVAAFVYFACIRPFKYWSERGIPQYSVWQIWREMFLGLIPIRSGLDTFKKFYDDFSGKRYSGLYQSYKPMLLVRDPDVIKQITVKDFDHFVDHDNFVPENLEPLWEKNLFSLRGETWKEMRATLSPSFTVSKMKVMFGLMADCAKQFVDHFEEQGSQTTTVEMKDVCTRFANDVIASTAFGVTCDSLRNKNNEFYLMGKEITNFGSLLAHIRLILITMAPQLAKALGISFFSAKASNFFRGVIKSNIEAREKNNIIRNDMIHLLLEARKDRHKEGDITNNGVNNFSENKGKLKKSEFNDDDITAQALIFFFAGFESISTAMCFMAYEIAVNPEVQQKLHDEVDDALDLCNGDITYEILMKMKYMDMVVSETLRKWNGAIAIDRRCVKDYVIKAESDAEQPVYLKKGDAIWIPVAAIHRDPQYYPNPDRFDPERFSDENKGNIAPYTFLPFGVGPRSCIGNRFALMEAKLLFFCLLSKFDITVVDKTPIPMKLKRTQFQVTAAGGYWLGLKARHSKN